MAAASAVVACGFLLGSCGGRRAVAPGGGSTSAATTIPGTGRLSACGADALAVVIGPFEGAAGSVGGVVTFTNVSGSTCTMRGYPELQMLDAAGHPISTEVLDGTSVTVPLVPERSVSLARHAEASFDLGFSDGTGYGSAHCPTSTKVRITPPNTTAALTVALRIAPYGGGTIATLRCGEITVSPVYAGGGPPRP